MIFQVINWLGGTDVLEVEGVIEMVTEDMLDNIIESEDDVLGMISHKMSQITIFGHKLFWQKFHQKFGIFHKKISTAFDFGSYLE